METLDQYFGNVCELDIVFNFNKVYGILDELIVGGEILETAKDSIVSSIKMLEVEDNWPNHVKKFKDCLFHDIFCAAKSLCSKWINSLFLQLLIKSFIFFLKLSDICKPTQHLRNSNIVPLFWLLVAEFGENFRDVLVFVWNHVFSAFRDINVNIFEAVFAPLVVDDYWKDRVCMHVERKSSVSSLRGNHCWASK